MDGDFSAATCVSDRLKVGTCCTCIEPISTTPFGRGQQRRRARNSYQRHQDDDDVSTDQQQQQYNITADFQKLQYMIMLPTTLSQTSRDIDSKEKS